ncbi:MAG: L-threonylcarbamoyladenylate synthase [Micropepsaceae bacterium]
MSLTQPTSIAIAEAARLLHQGELVAFPTETVYGLGADASRDRAVTRIFEAKGRPQFNPLIVHVATLEDATSLATFSALAIKLARRFWPGPLTLVVPRRKECNVSWLATAGLDTVAIRCPAHPVAQALLKAFGGPLAAPSANPSGTVSATAAEHVAEGLGHAVAMVLDGGSTAYGLESTIIGFDGDAPTMLRPGAVSREDIERVVGPLSKAVDHETAPHSPGRLKRHYATAKPLRLNATVVLPGEAQLAFGIPLPGAATTLNLSFRSDLAEAAGNLFAMLRTLDKSAASTIAVMKVPRHGLGEAINDRLERAAVRE